jgi:hypothetical protein
VILHVGCADRLKLPVVEHGEATQRVATARERRRPYALRIALEPSVDELGERLRFHGYSAPSAMRPLISSRTISASRFRGPIVRQRYRPLGSGCVERLLRLRRLMNLEHSLSHELGRSPGIEI